MKNRRLTEREAGAGCAGFFHLVEPISWDFQRIRLPVNCRDRVLDSHYELLARLFPDAGEDVESTLALAIEKEKETEILNDK